MIKLELSDEMVAVIGAALGNGPYQQVAPVIAEIQKQIEAQTKEKSNEGMDHRAVERRRGRVRHRLDRIQTPAMGNGPVQQDQK